MTDQSFPADAPEAQKPGQPLNVTVDAVSGGWVIRCHKYTNTNTKN